MSHADILIRLGTMEDYPRAHEVMAETHTFHQEAVPEIFRATDSPPPGRAALEELLRDGQGAWFLAEAEGHIVGFVTCRLRQPSLDPARVPETQVIVDILGILPAWQRRGIGQRLMETAEQWAQQHGAHRLMLNVWEFNAGAMEFYETLGYTPFSRQMWKVL